MKLKITSPIRLVTSLGRSLWHLLKDKVLWATPEEAAMRKAICENCQHLEDGQCKICTCYVGVKTTFQYEYCPLLKWGGERPQWLQKIADKLRLTWGR